MSEKYYTYWLDSKHALIHVTQNIYLLNFMESKFNSMAYFKYNKLCTAIEFKIIKNIY